MAEPKSTASLGPPSPCWADITIPRLQTCGPPSHLDTSHWTCTGPEEHISHRHAHQLTRQGGPLQPHHHPPHPWSCLPTSLELSSALQLLSSCPGAYEPHSALQFLWRASPSPRWARSALSGDLASASPLLSFSPHKPDPSVPTLNLPHVLIETLEGSSPKHLPRVRTEFGPPKASQTPNEARRITPGEGGGRRGPRLSRQKSQNPDRTRPSLLLISVQISVSGGSSARAM